MSFASFIPYCISTDYNKTCFTTYFLTFSIGIICPQYLQLKSVALYCGVNGSLIPL